MSGPPSQTWGAAKHEPRRLAAGRDKLPPRPKEKKQVSAPKKKERVRHGAGGLDGLAPVRPPACLPTTERRRLVGSSKERRLPSSSFGVRGRQTDRKADRRRTHATRSGRRFEKEKAVVAFVLRISLSFFLSAFLSFLLASTHSIPPRTLPVPHARRAGKAV
ncbi:hypothetical protein IWZ03DRAFT_385223 [Phyllosticta citriasiana]|uniref:Transmembrane protein n=1 Tax=Phyllosticta citriasiana TaxID=595635 RepID=A0ABR1KBZ5_9PEZI